MTKAMFGAGCFWGVEEVFRKIPGVLDAAVGYSGGTTTDPSYKQICTGTTGHAEVVELEFDPGQVSYEQLLKAFWKCHDATTLNRQGPDVGTQYRSGVYFYDETQRDSANKMRDTLNAEGASSRPIVTEIEPAQTFYRAEEYHQRYFEKNGGGGCHV